jgi:hypothetical protein
MSTCMWLNFLTGTGIISTAVWQCTVTFPLAQPVHSLHYVPTSVEQPRHTKRDVMMRRDARVPGCARPCMARNTARRWLTCTRGLSTPVEVSQSIRAPATCTISTCRELSAANLSTHVACAAARAAKSTRAGAGVAMAAAVRESASATTLLEPGTCRKSDVYSAM